MLGKKVTSKRIGLPMFGRVVGVETGAYWMNKYSVKIEPIWDEPYPLWREGNICTVHLDKPQKALSYEEFVKVSEFLHGDKLPDNETKVLYKYSVTETMFITYPEADLEEVEEDNE